jgi:hypothetical protein
MVRNTHALFSFAETLKKRCIHERFQAKMPQKPHETCA